MKYPEWSKNGFTNEYQINSWQRCGISDPKIAVAYQQCGIERHKVCKTTAFGHDFGTPLYSGISLQNACKWSSHMMNVNPSSGQTPSTMLFINNEELKAYIEAGIKPSEALSWHKLHSELKLYLTIKETKFIKDIGKYNLSQEDIRQIKKLTLSYGFKYLDKAGEWKKAGISFQELSSVKEFYFLEPNAFKKTTPELAKKFKDEGFTFPAIYYGLENNIDIRNLEKLNHDYNIDYEQGIIYLKYFSIYDSSLLHKNFKIYSLLNKYSFKSNVEKAHSLYKKKMPLNQVSSWIAYYKPKNIDDFSSAIAYYNYKINPVSAKGYKEKYIAPYKAAKYEKKIQKNCQKFIWSIDNPFDIKGKCLKLKNSKQSTLLNKHTAIFSYADSWIKIKSKNSIPKYFSGVIKITTTSKFTTPAGADTIIPEGNVIVNY